MINYYYYLCGSFFEYWVEIVLLNNKQHTDLQTFINEEVFRDSVDIPKRLLP